jgi:hypothetical protein
MWLASAGLAGSRRRALDGRFESLELLAQVPSALFEGHDVHLVLHPRGALAA